MNKTISGDGQVAAGVYEKIRITGSGRLSSGIRCASFHTSGESRGMDIECEQEFQVSGSCSFSRQVKANSVSVSGSFSCGGDIVATQKLSCSGSIECDGSVRCGILSVSGELEADGDVEADSVEVIGELDCKGLLNAETIVLKGAGMEIGSIGGSKITITRASVVRGMLKVPLLSSVIRHTGGAVTVKEGIEGDEIYLENVEAKKVSGRVVTIGEDCKIDLVQYSESINISPKASVGRTEKI